MANSELNALTAATAATGGIYYGEQSGASRKFTVTAAGATLLEAANAAAQRTALGLATGDSPQFTALNIGHASDTTLTRVSAGVIAVEGSTILVSGGALGTPASGTLSSCTGLPISTGVSGLGTGVATALAAGASTGGNGATDAGKVAVFNADGGIQFGSPTEDTGGTVVLIEAHNNKCLQLKTYANSMFGMDITSSAASSGVQAYVFHAQGTGQVGCAFDFTGANGTAFAVDFSGSASASNTVLEGTLDGAGKFLNLDGGLWTVDYAGVANFLKVTPAANATAITVNSATHTTNAPVLDAAQTWNAGGTTFTAVKLNVTNTASAAGSLLMDLQVGSASKFNVTKAGLIAATSSLELYNTAIDGTNYEKLTIDWSSNVLRIAPRSGGTGTGRGMTVGANNLPGYGYIHFAANGNVGFGTTGPSVNYEFGATWGCADAVNIVLGSTNGTKIGTATTQKIGFFNATPVIQQTANASIIDNTGGTPTTTFDPVGDTTSSNQGPLLNNVLGGIAAELNKIRTLVTNLGLGA